MTHLRELFDDLASGPAPASGLSADEVFTAGRRRHRRRSTGLVAAAATLVVLAGTVAGVAATGSGAEEPPAAARTAPAVTDPHPGEEVVWAGAADAAHLYLSFRVCSTAPCGKTVVQLAGSDDGGRTWTDRGGPIGVGDLAVLGPRTLLRNAPGRPEELLVSTDGAGTWSPVKRVTRAVAALPAGATLICLQAPDESGGLGEPCRLHAVEPAVYRLTPLAVQPALVPEPTGLEPAGSRLAVAGKLWVGGTDPATGRPAVAVSRDAGRTWSSHVFTDAAVCTQVSCGWPRIASADGVTAYVVITDPVRRRQLLYRGVSGRTWTAQPGTVPPYLGQASFAGSYVASDGTHVLGLAGQDRGGLDIDTVTFWAATAAGGGYQPVRLDGLPATVRPICRTPGGWFYTYSYPHAVLYGSDDGWHWSPVTR